MTTITKFNVFSYGPLGISLQEVLTKGIPCVVVADLSSAVGEDSIVIYKIPTGFTFFLKEMELTTNEAAPSNHYVFDSSTTDVTPVPASLVRTQYSTLASEASNGIQANGIMPGFIDGVSIQTTASKAYHCTLKGYLYNQGG